MARRYRLSRKKRTGRRRRSMNHSKSVIRVTRTNYGGTWAFGTAVTTDFYRYLTTTFADINNYTEFQALFDQYRVRRVKWTFRPRYDNVPNVLSVGNAATQAINTMPQAYMHYIIDQDAQTTPTGVYGSTSLNQMLESGKVKTKTLNRPVTISYVPKVAWAGVGSALPGFTKSSPWLQTAAQSVVHNGFYAYIQQNSFSTANTGIVLDVFISFDLEFRNIK